MTITSVDLFNQISEAVKNIARAEDNSDADIAFLRNFFMPLSHQHGFPFINLAFNKTPKYEVPLIIQMADKCLLHSISFAVKKIGANINEQTIFHAHMPNETYQDFKGDTALFLTCNQTSATTAAHLIGLGADWTIPTITCIYGGRPEVHSVTEAMCYGQYDLLREAERNESPDEKTRLLEQRQEWCDLIDIIRPLSIRLKAVQQIRLAQVKAKTDRFAVFDL